MAEHETRDVWVPDGRMGRLPSAAGLCLGIAAGGFFDGILLHQLLQWHHLLSNLEGAPFDDLRFQIFADGLFHVATYLLAGVGLWLLWRRPRAPRFWGDLLIGFGLWHILDAVLVHWILGLHNIRVDAADPLVWDLAFFAIGIVAVVLGLKLPARRPPGQAPALGLTLLLCGAGIWAMQPPPGASGMVALFRPDVPPAAIFAAIQEMDGRVLWTSREGDLWVLAVEPDRGSAALYRAGAVFVSRNAAPFGCITASRAS